MKLFTLPQNKAMPAGRQGFTLIELLIVIALLGALAVGLLATIDPFEQLKKGTDTSIRNTTAEFYNATLRYYASKSEFPWTTSTFSGSTLSTMTADINKLTDIGELKQQFYKLAGGAANLKKIYVSAPTTDQVRVCYQPQSKSFRNEQNNIYDIYGGEITGCPNSTSTTCHWCVQ